MSYYFKISGISLIVYELGGREFKEKSIHMAWIQDPVRIIPDMIGVSLGSDLLKT